MSKNTANTVPNIASYLPFQEAYTVAEEARAAFTADERNEPELFAAQEAHCSAAYAALTATIDTYCLGLLRTLRSAERPRYTPNMERKTSGRIIPLPNTEEPTPEFLKANGSYRDLDAAQLTLTPIEENDLFAQALSAYEGVVRTFRTEMTMEEAGKPYRQAEEKAWRALRDALFLSIDAHVATQVQSTLEHSQPPTEPPPVATVEQIVHLFTSGEEIFRECKELLLRQKAA